MLNKIKNCFVKQIFLGFKLNQLIPKLLFGLQKDCWDSEYFHEYDGMKTLTLVLLQFPDEWILFDINIKVLENVTMWILTSLQKM